VSDDVVNRPLRTGRNSDRPGVVVQVADKLADPAFCVLVDLAQPAYDYLQSSIVPLLNPSMSPSRSRSGSPPLGISNLIIAALYKANVRLEAMQATLEAVAHPQRREILRLVWDSELPSREIATHFEVTWQAVSHNLRVLREAGLLSERRVGTRRLYRADRARLGPLEAVLKDLWRRDLERLDQVVEQDRSEVTTR
jgi:DNA-binding transcriptional ArsR family regulator